MPPDLSFARPNLRLTGGKDVDLHCLEFHKRRRCHWTNGLPLMFAFVCLVVSAMACPAAQIVVDDLGRRIVLPYGARRIVALDPSVVEVLYAVGGGSRLVGVSTYTDYPASARFLPMLDGVDPSREVLAGLRPDLIMVTDQMMTRRDADQKSRLWGAPLFVSSSGSYEAVERKVAQYGAYFGKPVPTNATITTMRRALADVLRRVAGRPRPSVFDVVWTKPLMTAGRGSFINNLVTLAGGRDVAGTAAPYSEYPSEKLIADDPDIVLASQVSISETRRALAGMHLRAVARNRVCGISDDLITRAGPRLSQGIELIARILHPEAFVKP